MRFGCVYYSCAVFGENAPLASTSYVAVLSLPSTPLPIPVTFSTCCSRHHCFQHVRRIDSRPCHSARVLRRRPSHPALVPQAPVSSNNAHHWSGAHARRGRQRRPPPGTDRVIPSGIILGPAQPTEPRSGGPFAAGKGHTCANPNLVSGTDPVSTHDYSPNTSFSPACGRWWHAVTVTRRVHERRATPKEHCLS